jgi:hypothetical protein
MGLLLTTAAEEEFLTRACDLWLQVHEEDHFPETQKMRADVANVRRKLAGKYTTAERDMIQAAVLQGLD